MIDSFDFFYEDDYIIESKKIDETEKSIKWIGEVKIMKYTSVQKDLNKINEKKYTEQIEIKILEENIMIKIKDNNILIAYFILYFNHKYPLEAPKLSYIGPKYDLITNIYLTFHFKKMKQGEWTLHESISSIIDEVIITVKDKNWYTEKLIWSEDEWTCIHFLNELDLFKDWNTFNDYKKNIDIGKGVGYGDNKDEKISNIIEHNHKIRKCIFKKCFQLINSDFDKYWITYYNIPNLINNYIKKNSHLFINDIKEYLKIWTKFDSKIENSLYKKTNIEYLIKHINLNLIITDDSQKNLYWNSYHFKKEYENYRTEMNQVNRLYRRLVLEIIDLDEYSKINEANFRFAWSPDLFQSLQFVISSENEPYYGAFFIFHAFFPSDYPLSPPKVHLITTNGNTIRFNPNLYSNGKVCLSLLGTWSGEQWNPSVNNFLNVIQAISVMILTDQPIMNEPAYSSSIYFDSDLHDFSQNSVHLLMSKKYKYDIKYHCIKFALLQNLLSPDFILGSLIFKMYIFKKDSIIKSCDLYINNSKSSSFDILCKSKSFQINDESIFSNYSSLMYDIQQKLLSI